VRDGLSVDEVDKKQKNIKEDDEMRKVSFSDLLNLALLYGFDVSNMAAAVRGPNGSVKPSSLKKIPLEFGMYQACQSRAVNGKPAPVTLTELLEEIDPSENYPGCELNAFERQLAVRNLNVNGKAAVTLEEFYNTPENRVLFPEFINTQVKVGQLLGRYTLRDEDLIAVVTQIESGTYQAASIDETQDVSMGVVGQGVEFPTVSITVGDETIKLKKHGMLIKATYEHMRRIRANKMAVFFQLAGFRMMLDKTEDAVSVTINGDGNGNSAPVDTIGAIGFKNFVKFLAEFEPYEIRILAADKTNWIELMSMADFNNSLVAQQFFSTGNAITPFGSPVRRHDPSSSILSDKVLGVDASRALERIEESNASLTETERLVTSQWQNIAISDVVGYARIITNAARVWDTTNDLP